MLMPLPRHLRGRCIPSRLLFSISGWSPNYLDTRGVVAEHDPGQDRLTLTLSSQGSHSVRDILCRDVLRIDTSRMRVVTPDVGGGFGTKLFAYREYALAAVAAR